MVLALQLKPVGLLHRATPQLQIGQPTLFRHLLLAENHLLVEAWEIRVIINSTGLVRQRVPLLVFQLFLLLEPIQAELFAFTDTGTNYEQAINPN